MWLNRIPKSALKSIEKIIRISLSILVRVGVLKQGNFLRYFLHLVYIYHHSHEFFSNAFFTIFLFSPYMNFNKVLVKRIYIK